MSENDKKINDQPGSFDGGVNSLLRSLRISFIFLVVLIFALLIYFFTIRGFFRADSRQAVVVLRFGRYVGTYTNGWYWFMPYPVSRMITIPTNPRTISCSFTPAAALNGEEAPASLTPGRDSYLLTGDANIIHTSWNITYQIADPETYFKTLYSPGDYETIDRESGVSATWKGPDAFLQERFTQTVIEITGKRKVADILYGSEKSKYLAEVENAFSENIRQANCGIEIRSVNLISAAPPGQTKAAFDEVSAAVSRRTALIIEAEEYSVKTRNSAQAKATEIKSEAEIYRRQVVSELESQSIYFERILQEYQKSPSVLTSLYYNAISSALENLEDNFVLGSQTGNSGKQLRMKLNPEPRTGKTADAGEGETK